MCLDCTERYVRSVLHEDDDRQTNGELNGESVVSCLGALRDVWVNSSEDYKLGGVVFMRLITDAALTASGSRAQPDAIITGLASALGFMVAMRGDSVSDEEIDELEARIRERARKCREEHEAQTIDLNDTEREIARMLGIQLS